MATRTTCLLCDTTLVDRRKNKTFCGESCREAYVETITEKTCSSCEKTKPVQEFSAAKETIDRLTSQCKACVRESWEKWYYSGDEARIANAKANRNHYGVSSQEILHQKKLKRYNLTQDSYDKLVERSSGLCEICKDRPIQDIDHCHSSGEVRGLLCGPCNRSLGGFQDNIGILLNAVRYLRYSQQTNDTMTKE
jgi:hypothetical protein